MTLIAKNAKEISREAEYLFPSVTIHATLIDVDVAYVRSRILKDVAVENVEDGFLIRLMFYIKVNKPLFCGRKTRP